MLREVSDVISRAYIRTQYTREDLYNYKPRTSQPEA